MTRLATRGRISTDSLARAVPSAWISSTSGCTSRVCGDHLDRPPSEAAWLTAFGFVAAAEAAVRVRLRSVANIYRAGGMGASSNSCGRDPAEPGKPVYLLGAGKCYEEQNVIDEGNGPGRPVKALDIIAIWELNPLTSATSCITFDKNTRIFSAVSALTANVVAPALQ